MTATVGYRGDVNEVLCVERGDTSERNFGLALDVGTTTVVGHLVDLCSGITREAAAKYNSQIEYRRRRHQPHQLRPAARRRRRPSSGPFSRTSTR